MTAKSPAAGAKKTVLIVEDEKSLYEAISDKLEKSGFRAVITTNVDDALEHLKHEHVDVLWLDHYLTGDKDGLDLVVEIKSNKKWRGLPIYLISNTAGEARIHTYLKLGIDKYFVKSDHKIAEIIAEIQSATKASQ